MRLPGRLLCHRDGTFVPSVWHDCALGMAHLCHRDGTKTGLLPLIIFEVRVELQLAGHSALPEDVQQALLLLGADGTFAGTDAVVSAAAACRHDLGGKFVSLFLGEMPKDAEEAAGITDFPVGAIVGAWTLQAGNVGGTEDAPRYFSGRNVPDGYVAEAGGGFRALFVNA